MGVLQRMSSPPLESLLRRVRTFFDKSKFTPFHGSFQTELFDDAVSILNSMYSQIHDQTSETFKEACETVANQAQVEVDKLLTKFQKVQNLADLNLIYLKMEDWWGNFPEGFQSDYKGMHNQLINAF